MNEWTGSILNPPTGSERCLAPQRGPWASLVTAAGCFALLSVKCAHWGWTVSWGTVPLSHLPSNCGVSLSRDFPEYTDLQYFLLSLLTFSNTFAQDSCSRLPLCVSHLEWKTISLVLASARRPCRRGIKVFHYRANFRFDSDITSLLSSILVFGGANHFIWAVISFLTCVFPVLCLLNVKLLGCLLCWHCPCCARNAC